MSQYEPIGAAWERMGNSPTSGSPDGGLLLTWGAAALCSEISPPCVLSGGRA